MRCRAVLLFPALLTIATLASCSAPLNDVSGVRPSQLPAWDRPVALGQPLVAGDRSLTPLAVVEDSRCPEGSRCVWAGRVVVKTRIDGQGWSETIDLVAGEPIALRDYQVVLSSVMPEKGEAAIPPEDYRFVYSIAE